MWEIIIFTFYLFFINKMKKNSKFNFKWSNYKSCDDFCFEEMWFALLLNNEI